jgi:hypothetical protein
MRACFILLATLFVSRFASAGEVKLSETYRDSRTGFAIHYPRGWELAPGFRGFDIANFPPNKRPPQVLEPPDGAEIGIFAPTGGEKSVSGWMQKERVNESQGDRMARLSLITKNLGVLEITVARSEPSVFPGSTLLLYFFEWGGRPVKATLSYRGRRRAAEFEDILRAIIQNLEPLPAR